MLVKTGDGRSPSPSPRPHVYLNLSGLNLNEPALPTSQATRTPGRKGLLKGINLHVLMVDAEANRLKAIGFVQCNDYASFGTLCTQEIAKLDDSLVGQKCSLYYMQSDDTVKKLELDGTVAEVNSHIAVFWIYGCCL